MWCHERSRPHPRVGLQAAARLLPAALATALGALFGTFAGSAAAAEPTAPLLKVSGKASFITETRASGDSFEVRGTLSDEVGRPLANSEVRARSVSPDTTPTFHRCGEARREAGGELLLTTDKSGRVCVAITGMAAGSIELSYQDPRGYLERASRVLRLPDSVATSFELGFDPPLSTLSLDQPAQELGLVARGRGGATPPAAAELVLSMVADGLELELELGRTALDGLGDVHRLSLVSGSFGQPGPARLIGRLRTHEGDELAQVSLGIVRTATVALSLGRGTDSGIEPGALLQVRAASALGPTPSGVVEARSRGMSIAAAPVRHGLATLQLPVTPGAPLGTSLTLEYVGAGPGWLSAAPIELRVLAPAPSYARYVFWVTAAALAGAAVVRGWRRPPRPRPLSSTVPPRARASIEVLEKFGEDGGYAGQVCDAHDGTPVSLAAITFIGPGPHRPVLLQVRTTSEGSFRVETTFAAGTLVEVTAPFHATLTAPLPVPGVIELSLISRRRALMERLVRWAERQGKPWTRSGTEPTPADVVRVAATEAEPEVERWARGLEQLAFGPTPLDAASEQAGGMADDPKTTRERGID